MDRQGENERWGRYTEGVGRQMFGLEKDRAGHHDARGRHGKPYEMKACQLSVGVRGDPGKFFIKWENHEKLRAEGGYYVLILYDPHDWKQGPILAVDVKPAEWLDDVDRPWCQNGSRRGETVKRPPWTDVFSESDVPAAVSEQSAESVAGRA